jgi:tetratricopeptide (TPR) repeat protein
MQLQGRALVAQGRLEEGLALLDEAMTAVLTGELTPLATGWVYCSVILACKDLADLQRAGEWTEAARVWCEALPATTPYSQGLCRIYRGEVLALRGAWAEAEAELRRAHQELLPHKPQGAAEASYGVGEVLRRRGDLFGAEQAFVRAQQLGWDPQPGMALLRLAQGRVDAAAAALRSALASPIVDRFGRARLLAAQIEVAIAAGALDEARYAARELAAIADGLTSAVVQATASMAQAPLQLAAGDPAAALEELRRGLRGWRALGLPYEDAKTRLLIGTTQRMLGDEEGGRIEIDAARAGFERLGAAADARHAATLLQRGRAPRVLTDREVQVLRLVAAGKHNRAIAGALHLSWRLSSSSAGRLSSSPISPGVRPVSGGSVGLLVAFTSATKRAPATSRMTRPATRPPAQAKTTTVRRIIGQRPLADLSPGIAAVWLEALVGGGDRDSAGPGGIAVGDDVVEVTGEALEALPVAVLPAGRAVDAGLNLGRHRPLPLLDRDRQRTGRLRLGRRGSRRRGRLLLAGQDPLTAELLRLVGDLRAVVGEVAPFDD